MAKQGVLYIEQGVHIGDIGGGICIFVRAMHTHIDTKQERQRESGRQCKVSYRYFCFTFVLATAKRTTMHSKRGKKKKQHKQYECIQTSNQKPNQTEPNPKASEMCLKKAMAAHSISFFWSASLCIWKIRLASTLTLKHRHTHTGNAMPSCSAQFCSVGKWKKWIFDRFMTIEPEPESSPFLNYCHRNRRTKFRISFAFQLLLLLLLLSLLFPLRPPASTLRILVWIWFGFIFGRPFWLGRKKEARLWQVSFQSVCACRTPSYLG